MSCNTLRLSGWAGVVVEAAVCDSEIWYQKELQGEKSGILCLLVGVGPRRRRGAGCLQAHVTSWHGDHMSDSRLLGCHEHL